MDTPTTQAEFYASIPDIQSAINIGGDQAARIKLDVPATEIAELVKLVAMGGKLLRVRVQVADAPWSVAYTEVAE